MLLRWTVVLVIAFSVMISAHGCGLDSGCPPLNMTALNNSDDIVHALSDLGLSYDSGRISSQGCHLAAHQLGRRAFVLSNLSMAGNSNAHVCRSGFIHGLFEEAVARLNESRLSSVCSNSRSVSPAYSLNCFHGLGHGLYSRFDDVNRSMAYCWRASSPSSYFLPPTTASISASPGCSANI